MISLKVTDPACLSADKISFPLCFLSSGLTCFSVAGGSRASNEKLSDWRSQEGRQPRHNMMFQDTTRLRLMARPSLKDALQSFSTPGSTKLGRIGVSQSFREKMTTPVRPRDPPPPPPPPMMQVPADASGASYSLAKKFFSFNKTEMRRINRFLGITSMAESERAGDNNIYDIAENDEQSSDLGVSVVDNSTFYTTFESEFSKPHTTTTTATTTSGIKKNVSMRLRPKSNEFSAGLDPVKPPRAKRERSKSFTPRSNPLVKTSLFNRSLSHIPKSSSNSSLSGKNGPVIAGSELRDVNVKKIVVSQKDERTERPVSSSDLVHIFPDEERRSFKDIRKILSSPSISSSCSSSSSQIYRPKSQLSSSSSVINNSIKEEQIAVLPKEAFFEHIYEEIQDKDIVGNSSQGSRPLPPLPSEKQPSPARSSPIVSDATTSPVKSIFEGASKYDILNYLEDARERGLTDCDLELEEEEEEEAERLGESGEEGAGLILSNRNQNNRISNISTSSGESCEVVVAGGGKLSSVEIERNDSGLGSETGRVRPQVNTKTGVRKRSDQQEELLCLDCDQGLERER